MELWVLLGLRELYGNIKELSTLYAYVAKDACRIALGQQNIAPYLGHIAPPILACFHDPDHRVRYFACESMYNVAKVGRRPLREAEYITSTILTFVPIIPAGSERRGTNLFQ